MHFKLYGKSKDALWKKWRAWEGLEVWYVKIEKATAFTNSIEFRKQEMLIVFGLEICPKCSEISIWEEAPELSSELSSLEYIQNSD